MMHFVGIALAVFGGLWLFVQWAEWRERRAERREIKRIERLEKERLRPDEEYNPMWPVWVSLSIIVLLIVIVNH